MTMDLNANGIVAGADEDEDIAYGFALADDADDNGIADAGAASLGRRDGSVGVAYEPMADNIQAVAYAYAYDADATPGPDTYVLTSGQTRVIWAANLDADNLWENLDTNSDGDINVLDLPGGVAPAPGTSALIVGTATVPPQPVNPTQIRAVRIWLLARSPQPDPSYTDARTYVVGNKVITTNDNFRRRLLETTVECKNMGL
jgi:type IV pilus assembly protein PilW